MTSLDAARCRALVAEARVGRLATVTPDGLPHVVPCCFSVVGDRLYSVVDGKPKSTANLRRLDNIRARPVASLLVDHYDDDWTRLWWVRVDGRARVVEPDDADGRDEYETALDALAAEYGQYEEARPAGALVVVDVERLTGWAYAPGLLEGSG